MIQRRGPIYASPCEFNDLQRLSVCRLIVHLCYEDLGALEGVAAGATAAAAWAGYGGGGGGGGRS